MKPQNEGTKGRDARRTTAAQVPRYADGLERRLAIVGPDGNYLVGPTGTEEVIPYADLDTGRIAAEHQTFDFVGHYLRPDIFDLTVNNVPWRHPDTT